MNFRTLGWFGPNCPLNDPFYPFFPPQYMEIYDSVTGSNFNFPLETAMKIFWEASGIIVSASLVWKRLLAGQFIKFSSNFNETIQWGEVFAGPSQRGSVGTAKEMLCFLNEEFGYNTFKVITQNAQTNSVLSFTIDKAPFIYFYGTDAYKLFMPLRVRVSAGSGWAEIQSRNAYGPPFSPDIPQLTMGACNIFTPWGNTSTPLLISPNSKDSGGTVTAFVESASMSITVTGANPETRYA
jgi:hypothetical protein